MFEIYILLIILLTIIIIVYKKFNKPTHDNGEWLVVNKDIKMQNNLNWDITDTSVVKVLNFNKWSKIFFGSDLYIKIREKEGLVMNFKQECILDVCDIEMNSIYHIVNPKLSIFSHKNDPRIYTLEKNKKYIFFLRTDTDKNESIQTYKFFNMDNKEIKGVHRREQLCYLDEDCLFKDFFTECEKIRNAMLKRNYNLIRIGKSSEYLSFPNNSIANKLKIDSELGDVIVLVTTNKSITSEMKNHKVEVNSQNNSFNWKPEGESNITHLLLDNCDQDDTFCFYERTTNVKNGSNILPFQVLVFRRDFYCH